MYFRIYHIFIYRFVITFLYNVKSNCLCFCFANISHEKCIVILVKVTIKYWYTVLIFYLLNEYNSKESRLLPRYVAVQKVDEKVFFSSLPTSSCKATLTLADYEAGECDMKKGQSVIREEALMIETSRSGKTCKDSNRRSLDMTNMSFSLNGSARNTWYLT